VPIDSSIITKIIVGVVLIIASIFLKRLLERGARLIVYMSQVGEFHLQPQGAVHTHAVVINNAGRLPAQNVHVPHRMLLNANNIHVSTYPAIHYEIKPLKNNTEEIFFPTMPAKFQVTIFYLYFPPILFNQIHAPIYFDQGTAREIRVMPQQQFPRWVLFMLWGLVIIGAGTIGAWLWELAHRVIP
jgi:hypothetical protein